MRTIIRVELPAVAVHVSASCSSLLALRLARKFIDQAMSDLTDVPQSVVAVDPIGELAELTTDHAREERDVTDEPTGVMTFEQRWGKEPAVRVPVDALSPPKGR